MRGTHTPGGAGLVEEAPETLCVDEATPRAPKNEKEGAKDGTKRFVEKSNARRDSGTDCPRNFRTRRKKEKADDTSR